MKKSVWKIFLALVFVTVAFSGCAPAPTPIPPTFTPSLMPPTFTPEPTSTATQSQITIIEAPGNLGSTQDIGCVPISDLKNTFTPPDLYRGMIECADQGNYPSAAFFFALAGTYAYYDTLRVADLTAHAGRSVLVEQTLSSLKNVQMNTIGQEIENIGKNPDNLLEICNEILRIGAPQYHPHYMIQHGMNAITGGNPEDELVKDFDSDAAWIKALDGYMHCPNLMPDSSTATPESADLPILIARTDVPITVGDAEILIVMATNDTTKINDPFFIDMTSSPEETTLYIEAQVVSGNFYPFAEMSSLTDDQGKPCPLVSTGWLDPVDGQSSKPFWEFVVPKDSKSFTFRFPDGQMFKLDLILEMVP